MESNIHEYKQGISEYENTNKKINIPQSLTFLNIFTLKETQFFMVLINDVKSSIYDFENRIQCKTSQNEKTQVSEQVFLAMGMGLNNIRLRSLYFICTPIFIAR